MNLPTLDKRAFPTALYRLHDSNGLLLYVGISTTPIVRVKQHARDKDWWARVDTSRIALEWHPNRRAAEDAERQAIETERPIFNRDGSHPDALYSRLAATGQHVQLACVRDLDERGHVLGVRLLEHEAARKHLIAMAVAAIDAGMSIAEAARRAGYTREHTSKLYAGAKREAQANDAH